MRNSKVWIFGLFIIGVIEIFIAILIILNIKQFIGQKGMIDTIVSKYNELEYENDKIKAARKNEFLSAKMKINNIQLINSENDTFKIWILLRRRHLFMLHMKILALRVYKII